MGARIYFEDVEIGAVTRAGPYLLTAEAMLEFAREWDPLPIHIDEKAAVESRFGGLTASGTHLLAVKHLLQHQLPVRDTVVFSFGYEEVRFVAPGRPGQQLSIEVTWLEKRMSRSTPDCGIVKSKVRLLTAEDECLLTLIDTVLMKSRLAEAQEPLA